MFFPRKWNLRDALNCWLFYSRLLLKRWLPVSLWRQQDQKIYATNQTLRCNYHQYYTVLLYSSLTFSCFVPESCFWFRLKSANFGHSTGVQVVWGHQQLSSNIRNQFSPKFTQKQLRKLSYGFSQINVVHITNTKCQNRFLKIRNPENSVKHFLQQCKMAQFKCTHIKFMVTLMSAKANLHDKQRWMLIIYQYTKRPQPWSVIRLNSDCCITNWQYFADERGKNFATNVQKMG